MLEKTKGQSRMNIPETHTGNIGHKTQNKDKQKQET